MKRINVSNISRYWYYNDYESWFNGDTLHILIQYYSNSLIFIYYPDETNTHN